MYEVEVKVPADLEAVRDRLEALGATRKRTVVQADTYYDAPHRSFPETDEALRIRRESSDGGDESRITYKGPLLDDESKSREEFETGVDDGETMDAVLTGLGFEAAATVRKERERYGLEGYTVTLDAVDDVGEYVEVETEVSAADEVESAREGAYDVLERLDLDPDDQLRTSYLGLLLES
ncbi:class IV adenylate cyclase [Haloterrigena sp. SYSU A558-1]|uniref:Class IV adenylate cyclase n=1 Tax=Haloterrigena gelatinilytica TaxID=2741724 RepID=A0A8J8GML9_9EURY|nr:class IV adenylate cyclase [Haloterrigena gelatinilytica]NUB91935.1 class IV adenylate cyclase [Haloterrigena gelatinilytica]NUC72239.1 class IV adenylate cyclase [Haloterrigena gelatinilytica]